MDVLVSLGTNASYIYSLISILHHHFAQHHMTGSYQPTDFFETAAMLITFILLGKYLEASAKGKTSAAITQLLTLTPATAVLLTLDKMGEVTSEEEVPTALIHKGDHIKVHSHACRRRCVVAGQESANVASSAFLESSRGWWASGCGCAYRMLPDQVLGHDNASVLALPCTEFIQTAST